MVNCGNTSGIILTDIHSRPATEIVFQNHVCRFWLSVPRHKANKCVWLDSTGYCNTWPTPFPVCFYQNIIMTPTPWHYCNLAFYSTQNIVSLSIINNKQNQKKKKKKHRKAKPYLLWKWWIIESGRHTHRRRHRHARMHTNSHAHMLHTHSHTHTYTGGNSPLGLQCHLELVCRTVH